MSQNPQFVKMMNKCKESQVFKNIHRKRGKTKTFLEVSTFGLNILRNYRRKIAWHTNIFK